MSSPTETRESVPETSEATETPDAADERPVEDLPLPPYPPNLGPPSMHIVRQMQDRFAFSEQALTAHDVYRMKIVGKGDFYTLGHPDHMKRVLLTERDRFRKSDDFLIAFGEGVLTVEGEEWRKQRDMLQPLFTRDSVMDYADGMVEQIRRRSDRWQDGDRFDLQAEFTDMTLDVLCATVLGRELELDGDEELREAAEGLHDWFLPSSYFLPDWMPTPARRNFKDAKRTIEQESQRLLDEAAGDAPTDPTEADDLLSLLVGLRESGMAEDAAMLTDERLRDQMVTMIFAGHDTTTGSLTFAFWALANSDDIRERFHEEVDQLNGPPTMDDLDDLAVTEKIITETLRLYPPVYSMPRVTNETMAFDGYRIPEDSNISVSIRGIQRDDRWYDDPNEFRPDRWTDEFRKEIHNFAYAPFGGGPRICIGREFALLEAKLALATIGQEYDLYWLGENDENGDPPTAPQMTLRMEPGNEFLVTER